MLGRAGAWVPGVPGDARMGGGLERHRAPGRIHVPTAGGSADGCELGAEGGFDAGAVAAGAALRFAADTLLSGAQSTYMGGDRRSAGCEKSNNGRGVPSGPCQPVSGK